VDEGLIRTWMNEYSADLMSEKIRPESVLPAPSELKHLASQCKSVYSNFTRALPK
jgi:hypothetical protein